jgi:hypothetical protein
MRIKSIQHRIAVKFDAWVSSIADEALRKLVKNHTIITGGCITSMLTDAKVNDYDVYFDNVTTCLAVAQYYVDKFVRDNKNPKFGDAQGMAGYTVPITVRQVDDRVKVSVVSAGVADEGNKAGYAYFEDPGIPPEAGDEYAYSATLAVKACKREEDAPKEAYRPVFLSSNAITLSDKIQLVTRFYGAPSEIHKNFDFVHCTNYWYSGDRKLYLNQDALASIMGRELRYVGSKYPLSAMIRLRKFYRRGWWMSAGQMLKLVYQVNALDLDNPAVLEEQLVGMDFAYFAQLLDILRSNKASDPNLVIDQTYVCAIIDRMESWYEDTTVTESSAEAPSSSVAEDKYTS